MGKLKVFISWSGDRSHGVARALYDWLPDVLHLVQPFLSSLDIKRGERWGLELARRLDQNDFGILCLTPENLTAPWILFEAGAPSKRLDEGLVCPYLLDLPLSELKLPLNQFNAATADPSGTLQLLKSINSKLEEDALPPHRLENAFERWWPDLEARLNAIPKVDPDPLSGETGLLEEVLELARKTDERTKRIEALLNGLLSKSQASEILEQLRTEVAAETERRVKRPMKEIYLEVQALREIVDAAGLDKSRTGE